MKRFILNLSFFLIPFTIPLIIEMGIRNIPNDYKNKNAFMLNKASEIETLILGSSHTHLGINPIHLDSKSYNLAFLGENISYSSNVYKKFSPKLKNLKTIIFPVSYHSLFNSSMSKKWIKNYSIYYDINSSDLPVDNLEILNKDVKTIYEDLVDYYINHNDSIYLNSTSLGWYYKKKKLDTLKLSYIAKKTAKNHTHKDHGQLAKNCLVLLKLAHIWKSNNINVILITPPFHEDYIKNMDNRQWQTTLKKVKELDKQFDNLDYYNFYNDKHFNKSDFKDGDHLNKQGAKKLTIILNDIINHRNNL